MERKIIQISASASPSDHGSREHVYALCNDGTVWQFDAIGHYTWTDIPPIPQPESIAPSVEENKDLLSLWAIRQTTIKE